MLKKLNPDLHIRFAAEKTDMANLAEGLDRGKTERAATWSRSQDTKSTEHLIGEFKQVSAEQSITDNYKRVVAELKKQRVHDMDVATTTKPEGGALGAVG